MSLEIMDAIVIKKRQQKLTVQAENGNQKTEFFSNTAGAKKIEHIHVGDSVKVLVNPLFHTQGSIKAAIEKILL